LNLVEGYHRWSETGYLIGWSDSTNGKVLQADCDAPGILWKKASWLLPPGKYRFRIRYAAMDTNAMPVMFRIQAVDGRDTISLGLPETSGGAFHTETETMELSRWQACDMEILYGGTGVFTLDDVECLWTAPDDRLMELPF
jgi:hypothetical protein